MNAMCFNLFMQILFVSHPFQISEYIVGLIVVYMMHNLLAVWIWDECHRNQLMHPEVTATDFDITISIRLFFLDEGFQQLVIVCSSNSAEVADFVEPA